MPGTRTTRTIASLALVLAAALFFPTPGSADTQGQLDAAKRRLAEVQQALDRATAAYADAQARYTRTTDQISLVKRDIAATERRMDRIRGEVSARARSMYENGVGGTIDSLLSSGSLGELSDRVEFLGAVQQSDTDLVTAASVTSARLQRQRHDLEVLAASQQRTAARLQDEKGAIQSRLGETQSLIDELTQKLKAEQRTRAALSLAGVSTVSVSVSSGGALATCPVYGPHSYVDSFGAPRSGGRSHEGDDIMAPRGTPVVAAQSGNAVQDPNDLGGNSMLVYASNGDYTYYAHLDSYGATGSVSAGTVIGYVGNTGDAAGGPTHLHFEYHPGGGAAVDPTPYLDAVC